MRPGRIELHNVPLPCPAEGSFDAIMIYLGTSICSLQTINTTYSGSFWHHFEANTFKQLRECCVLTHLILSWLNPKSFETEN